jgi:ubiquinone/menaquinone biosynthesis C-methylase UbiE
MRLTSEYPVVDGVHVCVPDDQHVGSFSEQWDRWATVQVDSKGYRCGYIGSPNSTGIFIQKTGMAQVHVLHKVVLDAGCGTGRFSEVVASFGAKSVIAVDLSRAVFHAAKLGQEWRGEHTFIQASLESLPLPDASVDVAFSIGVLHHTPEPAKAVREIARVLKPGGTFAGWVYAKQAVYSHPLRKVWRDFSTNPANREAVLKLAMEAPRLRDLYAAGKPTEAVAEAVKILPFLGQLAVLDPGSFRAIVGISGSTNDEECCLDSSDWMTPRYQWQYTWDEWNEILKQAGFQAAPLQFPVSWLARRE